MVTVNEFYAESGWGLRFGASGAAYTIVPGRHIGQDIARTGDVPALLPGKIIRRVRTNTMAWGVVTDIGSGLYLSYWHLADDNLPPVGTYLQQGDRVGRLALGARNSSSPDWPGTAWTGPHCHIVIGTNPGSAYLYVPGHRTLDAFRDPLIFVRQVLASAAGRGSTPLNPDNRQQEEDEMPIRIISAPAWEAAGKRLITNGSSVLEVPAGAAQVLIQNGIPYRIYEGDNANTDMLYEVSVNWALGGLDAGTVAEKVKGITATVDFDSSRIAEDIASRLKIVAS